MSWTSITRYGNGRVRYAAVIEGWPEIWVTDHSITLSNGTNGARGRTVRVGLKRDGLSFSERAQLLQGRLDASPMTFRFVSNDHTKQAVESFATMPVVFAEIAANLNTDDDKVTVVGTPTVVTGYYHVGTEVIHITAPEAPTDELDITRAHWDTQAQSFYILDGEDVLTHQIYTRPRTMEGRRITLYAWGDGDDATRYDPDGEQDTWGRPVWRGLVSLPPKLERGSGVTWTITADHISVVFRQSLAARNTEIRPVGFHFHVGAPLFVGLANPASGKILKGKKHIFFSPTRASFQTTVNQILANIVADATTNLGDIFTTITLEFDDLTGTFYLKGRTVASPPSGPFGAYALDIRSHLTGYITTGRPEHLWLDNTGAFVGWGSVIFEANEDYRCYFIAADWSTEEPGDPCVQIIFNSPVGGNITTGSTSMGASLGAYDFYLGVSTLATSAHLDEWSRRRIFIDRDWNQFSSRGIVIIRDEIERGRSAGSGNDYYASSSINLEVIDNDYDATYDGYWIRVRNTGDGKIFHGWVHGYTVIRPTYAVENQTDVVGLVNGIITDVAANANDGNLPFLRNTDFDTDTEVVTYAPEITRNRTYSFVKPVPIEDVLAEELKLIGHMWSTDIDSAKTTFVAIPILTGGIAATRDDNGNQITVSSSEIQTPAGGAGSFPGYEIQSQGIVSVVIVKDKYDPATDEHKGAPHYTRDANLLSTHKRRGLTDLTIAPKSTCDVDILPEYADQIAARMMAVMGREYITVKVQVPFTRFRVMLGDVVIFTSPHVPNSSGGMGVSNKKALVVGRRWNLDPERNEHGELELLILLDEPAGYTPSGVITSHSGSGTTWTLTLSPLLSANILVSPRGDGDVASTFAVGDEIRIVEEDDTTPTIRSGTVTAQSGNTVSVSLTSSWTPGSSGWDLEYADATAATAAQRVYAFVAGEDLLIDDEDAARRFA